MDSSMISALSGMLASGNNGKTEGENVAPVDGLTDQQAATTFHKLLSADTPTSEAGALLQPDKMIDQQLGLTEMVVGVDFGAKVASGISQTVNKLVNIT